jgi:hypothetical protein
MYAGKNLPNPVTLARSSLDPFLKFALSTQIGRSMKIHQRDQIGQNFAI